MADGWDHIIKTFLAQMPCDPADGEGMAAWEAAQQELRAYLQALPNAVNLSERFRLRASMCRLMAPWCRETDERESYEYLAQTYERMAQQEDDDPVVHPEDDA